MPLIACIWLVLTLLPSMATAQPEREGTTAPAQDPKQVFSKVASTPATFYYANRPITILRAQILSNIPEYRARAAESILDGLVVNHRVGAVTTHEVSGVYLIRVGDRDVLSLVPADLDPGATETLQQKANDAAGTLRVALSEAIELRTPAIIFRAGLKALGVTLLILAAVVSLWKAHPRIHRALSASTENALCRVLPPQVAHEQMAIFARLERGAVLFVNLAITGLLTYWWLTYSLQQFPYTRPLGESLSLQLLHLSERTLKTVVEALPNLFIVIIIVTVTRLLVQISNVFFASVAAGRAQLPWTYPETAIATKRLVAIVLWLFAIVISYPFVPASGSEAFKGVSVFVGLVISLGSSGVVNQLMSGLTLTYSRALKVGDSVKIGDTEGIVTAMNLLSVKVRTIYGEEVTVPNTVVIGQSTVNYTRLAPSGSALLAINLSIGYDTPWRQVRELLVRAAEQTPNIRRNPPPHAAQDALDDFYVRYKLLVCLDDPNQRAVTRDQLLSNIQDAFNEAAIQIMSPHYETDPESPKLVPPARRADKPQGASTRDRGAA